MSEILHHYLKGENIVNKLREAGAIVSRELIRHDGSKLFFENCLDYSVCCPEEWNKKREELYELAEKENWFEKDKHAVQRIEEYKYYPIRVDDRPHDIFWESKWDINDEPMFYISKLLPDDILAFEGYYRHSYDCGCFYKNGEDVNINGDKCYNVLSYVKNTSVQDSKGMKKIVLPYLDSTKKENFQLEISDEVSFASIYIKAANIVPHGGFLGSHLCATADEYNSAMDTDRYDILLTSETIPVYFHADNKTEKIAMSVSQLKAGFDLARQAYKNKQLNESMDPEAVAYEESLSDYGLYDDYMNNNNNNGVIGIQEENEYDDELPFN